ncbi:hypothetical protein NLG97_g137 [Lecanicillium saksenae]|uniref:Uncharacterized protein n=1 Tax=Lecanicillium saksenae TaxID=468837 RepID=A0ACC1R8M9_9HYPO|nr:hypothetical protein NLG97_g137 [Lecanicillium saksenae]
MQTTVLIGEAVARYFSTSVLQKLGTSKENAELVTNALVLADLRGVDTHGLNRLPGYAKRIQCGVLDPNPSLSFDQKTVAMAHLDARNTFGFIAGCLAIDKAVEMAGLTGVAIVAVKNSNHYGMGATYVLRVIERGYAAFAFTNASRAMPAWGRRTALLGTSPLAIGVPGGPDEGDFVLDMSPTVAARGKIRKAARRGESIPEGYALDEHGLPTTDPAAALRGVMLPIGGPKGSGLAMMMDIFGGLITGASFGGAVNDQYNNVSEPQGVGHWFMVFKPELFLDSKRHLADRMDSLLRTVRSSEKAPGCERIFTPGENAAEIERARREHGIPFTVDEIGQLNSLADQIGSPDKLSA